MGQGEIKLGPIDDAVEAEVLPAPPMPGLPRPQRLLAPPQRALPASSVVPGEGFVMRPDAPQPDLAARYLQEQVRTPAPTTPPAAAPATVPAGMALPEAVMDIRKTVQVPQIDPTDVRFLIEEGVWPEDAPKYASVMRNAGFIDKAGYATPHFQEWVKKNLREVPFWADPRD
jgi:spermidine/putrescine-binding protein